MISSLLLLDRTAPTTRRSGGRGRWRPSSSRPRSPRRPRSRRSPARAAAHVDDPLAQLGVRRERRDGLVEQRAARPRRSRRRSGSSSAGRLAGGVELAVGVERGDDRRRRSPSASCRRRARSSSSRSSCAEAAVEAGEPGGDRRDRVGVADAERDLLEQLLERHGRLAVERRRCRRARSR